MKKHNIKERAIAIVMLLMFLMLIGRVGYWETHYTEDATVIAVTGQIITVKDEGGQVWEFYGDGYEVGDRVHLHIDNNETDNTITDDKVVSAKLVTK